MWGFLIHFLPFLLRPEGPQIGLEGTRTPQDRILLGDKLQGEEEDFAPSRPGLFQGWCRTSEQPSYPRLRCEPGGELQLVKPPHVCAPPAPVPVWQDGAFLCQDSEELSWVLNMPAASLPARGAGRLLPSACRESETPPGGGLSSCQGSPCSLPLVLLLSTCGDKDGRAGGFAATDGAGQGAPSTLLPPPRAGWPLDIKRDNAAPLGHTVPRLAVFSQAEAEILLPASQHHPDPAHPGMSGSWEHRAGGDDCWGGIWGVWGRGTEPVCSHSVCAIPSHRLYRLWQLLRASWRLPGAALGSLALPFW